MMKFLRLLLCIYMMIGKSLSFVTPQQQKQQGRMPSTSLQQSDDNNDSSSSFTRRFTNPVLDDPFLPLTDGTMAQIVAPALQVFYVTLVQAPYPSWLQVSSRANSELLFFEPGRGSLVAPVLIHGAGLACCWLLGALAAKAYEQENIDPTVSGYGQVLFAVMKAGAFATGVLIFATQMDLLSEFGRYVQLGESPETDLRLLTAWTEGFRDVLFEAVVITSMRMYLAVSIARRKGL